MTDSLLYLDAAGEQRIGTAGGSQVIIRTDGTNHTFNGDAVTFGGGAVDINSGTLTDGDSLLNIAVETAFGGNSITNINECHATTFHGSGANLSGIDLASVVSDEGTAAYSNATAFSLASHTHTLAWTRALQVQAPQSGTYTNTITLGRIDTAVTLTNLLYYTSVGTSTFVVCESTAGQVIYGGTYTTNNAPVDATTTLANDGAFDDAAVAAGTELYIIITSTDAGRDLNVSVSGTTSQ
jgi:hypothetical protein